ncbi:hypothetical protein MHU86_23130 [Fragilaria crotonensis]|nr:hypothetical protein MHU86_23130 [Fragilaria crotonensis]
MQTFANWLTQPIFKHAAAILTPSSTTFELFATFPHARTAILTLRRHCAPLTPDHVERTREAFCSIKQPHHEVATSYLNRIRILTRDCYHAGIPNTDAELIKRTVRGGSNHSFYAASYQRFDADIRRAELNDEALPPFAELESHLLNIDESRGLTLPSQNQRNYNQHAHSTRQQSHHFQSRHPQTTHRVFTQRQQQAFSSILRPYSNPNGNNQNRSHPPRPPQNHSRPFRPPTNPSRPPFNNPNQRRPPPPSPRPSNQPQRNNRPPFRPTLNPNQRPSPNGSNINQSRNSASTQLPSSAITADASATIRATVPTQDPTKTIASNPQRSTNNENAAPRNQQRAYFVTDSSQDSQNHSRYHHQAFKASSLINLMINKTTSHGPILYLRCLSINLYLIEIIFQLPTMLLPTLEPQLISLMTPNHHTKDLVPHSLQTGYLTVVLPAIILHSSATSVMLNPAVSQSPS